VKSYTLENSQLDIKVLPELGGRIESLIYKPTNKNWVWKNKKLPNTAVSKFSNYDDNWQGGWEELFPNDAVEKFSWGQGFDHGELWSSSWSVEDYSNEHLYLKATNLESTVLFEKKFEIADNKLTCRYTSRIEFEDYFLFKLHLAIPIEDSLKIKCNYDSVEKVDKNFGNITDEKNIFEIKKNTGLFDFSYINLNKKQVVLEDSLKNTLMLSYGDEYLDSFWLFQSQGGWRNHNVVVLEPASNSKKYINDAVADGKALKGPMSFKCKYQIEVK
jgi:galactose mutarotase-like enzyme